eukprot:gene2074-1946_t
MPYLTFRRPQRSFFNSVYDDFFDFTPTYSIFQQPSTILAQKSPFEELFSTFNQELFYQKISEKDEVFEVKMNFSKNIPKENVQIEVEDGILTIKAEHKNENSFESYSKRVTIPSNIDVEKISAKLNNGQLKISIPRVESNLIEEKKEKKKENEEKKKENEEKKEIVEKEDEKIDEAELIIEDINEQEENEEKKPLLDNVEKLDIEDSDIYGAE